MKRMKMNGFTLIELLIVVAIIAILAAIAIPNFLAAQIRAKVSRAKANMRTAATALESYYIDSNTYPGTTYDGSYTLGLPIVVTTPIAYITTIPVDDFDVYGSFGPASLPIKYKIAGWSVNRPATGYSQSIMLAVNQSDGLYATDQVYYLGPNDSNYKYALFSLGPGHQIAANLMSGSGWFTLPGEGDTGAVNGHFPQPNRYWYDPTNGTVSIGYVVRLPGGQNSP